MTTNKQRREAERRRLQQQLAERREREVARRRVTLISSVVGSLLVVALIVVIVVVAVSGGDDKKTQAGASGAPKSSTPAATSPSPSPSATPGHPATGAAVTFDGVTVKGAKDLTGYPVVTSTSSKPAPKLLYKDLVVGTGKPTSPTASVTVQYTGVLYSNGKEFDSSWKRGQPAQFSLTGVVPGFTQGIGGTKGVPPMRIGGRRIMIFPGSLGYGANGQGDIPPNASLVFVVDLVSSAAAS